MVTVIDFKKREMENDDPFFVLVLQGGIEPIRSAQTGKIYFTAKTATVPATFDEDTCASLIGTEFPGTIQKEKCEPYEYVIDETGEVIEVSHRNVYVDDDLELFKENVVDEMEVE